MRFSGTGFGLGPDNNRKLMAEGQIPNRHYVCIRLRVNEYYLATEHGIDEQGRKRFNPCVSPERIMFYENIELNLKKPRVYTFKKDDKVLSLKKSGDDYTKRFFPATVVKKIDGDPAKYLLNFGNEESEISECLIVPTEDKWSLYDPNKVVESPKSDDESDSSSSSSTTTTSSSSYSSYDSDSYSYSDYHSRKHSKRYHKKKSSKRRHHKKSSLSPNIIVVPIIMPVYYPPQYYNQNPAFPQQYMNYLKQ